MTQLNIRPPSGIERIRANLFTSTFLPADFDNSYRPYVELTGDIAQTLNALSPQLKRSRRSALSSSILEAIAAERTQLSRDSGFCVAGCRSTRCDWFSSFSSSSART